MLSPGSESHVFFNLERSGELKDARGQGCRAVVS